MRHSLLKSLQVLTVFVLVLPEAGLAADLTPPLLPRDAALIASIASIEDVDQRAMIQLLLEDFAADHVAVMRELRATQEELPDSDLAPLFERSQLAEHQLQAVTAKLLQSLRAIMTPEEQLRFNTFWADRVRQKRLAAGRFAAERVDLSAVVHEVLGDGLAPSSALSRQLDLWKQAVDAALERRRTFDLIESTRLITLARDQRHTSALEWAREALVAHQGVRRATMEAVEGCAATLGGHADVFRSRVLERAYPRIWRSDSVDRIAAAAHEKGLFDPIAGVILHYGTEREHVRLKARSAAERAAEANWLRPLEQRAGLVVDAGGSAAALVEGLRELRLLELDALDQLCALLGDVVCTELNEGRFPLLRGSTDRDAPFPEAGPAERGEAGPAAGDQPPVRPRPDPSVDDPPMVLPDPSETPDPGIDPDPNDQPPPVPPTGSLNCME